MNPGVLIVDDEEHILRSIKRLLRRDGYEIHLADSGRAAMDVLAEKDIAVIICDQRMPGMTGAEVLAEAYKLHPDQVRITLTGYTDLAAAQASINEGQVNHFLLKPWNDDHLRTVVREGVRKYLLVQDHRRLEDLTRRQKKELQRWNQKLEAQVRKRTEELRTRNQHLLEMKDRLERSLRDTVVVLAGVLEAHNPNVGLHSKRVAEFARTLGEKLSLTELELRDVEFAARLHDVGKISKPHRADKSRSRRDGLGGDTPSFRHSDSGGAILSHVGGFENIARGVRHQCEHYDGNGHPDGLKEDEIPLVSRIIAVADAYDAAAFSSANPTEVSRGAGRKVLLGGKGKRFDPVLVDLVLQHLDDAGVDHCADAEVELSPRQLRVGMVLSREIRNADGLLLLTPGARLTAKLIRHLQSLNGIDPLLDSVFIKCVLETEESSRQAGERAVSPADDGTKKEGPSVQDEGAGSGTKHGTPSETGDRPGPRPSGRTPEQEKKQILVVDDVMMMCNALKRELRAAGYDAVAVTDGHDALQLVQDDHFDVVISDLLMPAMSGEELIGRLRQCAPSLPCIILTGNAKTTEVVRVAKSPNVAGVLVKPWDKERLLGTVKSVIEKHRGKPAEALV